MEIGEWFDRMKAGVGDARGPLVSSPHVSDPPLIPHVHEGGFAVKATVRSPIGRHSEAGEGTVVEAAGDRDDDPASRAGLREPGGRDGEHVRGGDHPVERCALRVAVGSVTGDDRDG